MTKYYDKENKRLVFIGLKSDEIFWDNHWKNISLKTLYPDKIRFNDYVINYSKKYLKPKSLILEGGCGTGQQVHKLNKAGFNAIGIDFAPKTIENIKKLKPELNVLLGDVRKLEFKNSSFDAYWSFGVIEHFYFGYDEIFKEMSRVLKPDGYLFVTFPHMSKIRKRKAKNKKYPLWKNEQSKINHFYQFALDEKKVQEDFNKYNFELIDSQQLAAIKGLKDEWKWTNKLLQRIYDSKNIIGMGLSKFISIIFRRFSSHSILLILKNKKQYVS